MRASWMSNWGLQEREGLDMVEIRAEEDRTLVVLRRGLDVEYVKMYTGATVGIYRDDNQGEG